MTVEPWTVRSAVGGCRHISRDKHPDDRLWSSSAGGFLRPGHSSQGWFAKAVQRTMAADASFRRVTPHDLRHTAASLAISAGANVKVVQRMLGHKSAKVTLDMNASGGSELQTPFARWERMRAS